MGFERKFTTIKGISEKRRLPLLGKIRLGVVVKKKKYDAKKCKHKKGVDYCRNCSYPQDVPHFILPKELEDKYGKTCTELPVTFPINSIAAMFPQSLKWYGFTGLKCEGNGEVARRYDEKQQKWVDRECPCEELKSNENEKGQCGKNAMLFVMLWEINMGGVYRVVSGSINSIIDVASGMDFTQNLVGRFARVPLYLRREKTETTYINKEGKRMKSIHYPLKLFPKLSAAEVANLRRDNDRFLAETSPDKLILPEIRDNPNSDAGAVIVSDAEKKEVPTKKVESTVKKEATPTQEPVATPNMDKLISEQQRKKIMAMANKMKLSTKVRRELMVELFNGKDSTTALTIEEAGKLIETLTDLESGGCEVKQRKNGTSYIEYPPAQD